MSKKLIQKKSRELIVELWTKRHEKSLVSFCPGNFRSSVSSTFNVPAIYLPPILAVYFALVINLPFLISAYAFIKEDGTGLSTISFLLLLPLFLVALFVSLCSLLCTKYLEKPLLTGFTLISSIVSFSYWYYGLIFDDHSPILGVVLQTNWQEMSPFLTPSFILWFFFTGLIPSFIIYKIKIVRGSWKKEMGMKLVYCMIYPLFYVTILFPHLSSFHPLIRLSGIAARPPFQITPTNFFENAFHYYNETMAANRPYKKIGLDAKQNHTAAANNLLVLVIGETARNMNFELNGYTRATNAYTAKQQLISFRHMTSCATSTRVSIPCIFSRFDKNHFNLLTATREDNLLDILKRAGLNLFWIDNNGAGDCQGVCKRIESMITHYQDAALIQDLVRKIQDANQHDTVIVLHLQGSHGPNYHEKYPPAFQRFKPDCQHSELRLCDQHSLINAYDNSILYTDFVLHELIKALKKQTKFANTAMIYTSDHGESIGERGLYGHCAPYSIAPNEQTQVPLMIWMSKTMMTTHHISRACLKKQALHHKVSHDYLFHSILNLMDVSTALYQNKLDLFRTCRSKS